MSIDERPTLLLVDDESTNLHVLRHTLQDVYRLLFATEGETALELANSELPDLILLDVMMPGLSGYDVCQKLKNNSKTKRIPVIFVTALADQKSEEHGFSLGAVDYIVKPFSPSIVRARVKTHLSLVRAEEVLETRLRIVQTLGAAAEYKDTDTGKHTMRMSRYAYVLAKAMGCSEKKADLLLYAAPMHDIGKIGIPDSILLKPGKLTAEEWAVMRTHTTIGENIIGEHHSELLQLAARIARSHHEKWDGTGYPDGLAVEEIPFEARIIALADVFDALTSPRSYKKSWTIEEATAYIREQSGVHFDPKVVEAFERCLAEFYKIQECLGDEITD